MQGKYDSAYARLNNILGAKPHLISSRGFLSKVIYDEKIKEMLNKHYSENELKEFYSVIENEKTQAIEFIETAKRLRDYYIKKSKGIYNEKKDK